MNTAITSPTREQIPCIAEFLDRSWKVEYREIIDPAWLDSMLLSERTNGLFSRYDNGVSEFLIVTEDDVIIGAAVFGKSFTDGYPDDGEISAIYLDTNHIGTGLGSRLLAAVEARLIKMGYANLVLDVLTENKRAITFYQKHGYKQVQEAEIRLGDRDYPLAVMRKTMVDA